MSPNPNNVFYVYGHYRASDGSLFYIGKGKGSRLYSRSGRSTHWRNIVKKNGYEARILFSGLSECEAYRIEEEKILEARANKDRVCNIANGGNGGLSGIKLTCEHKEKLRLAKIGKKQMPDHAAKSAKARLGKKNSKAHVEKTVSKKRKKVINSEGVVYISATAAARAVGSTQGNISMVARGERREAGGLNWSYNIEEVPPKPKPVSKRILMVCEGIEFNSTKEAVEHVKQLRGSASQQCITYAARSGNKSYGSFWRYIE